MNQESLNGIKQQLWDYYKKMNEYAAKLAYEVTLIDIFSGEQSTKTFIPLGLRDEIIFTRDEIGAWQKYEKESEMK